METLKPRSSKPEISFAQPNELSRAELRKFAEILFKNIYCYFDNENVREERKHMIWRDCVQKIRKDIQSLFPANMSKQIDSWGEKIENLIYPAPTETEAIKAFMDLLRDFQNNGTLLIIKMHDKVVSILGYAKIFNLEGMEDRDVFYLRSGATLAPYRKRHLNSELLDFLVRILKDVYPDCVFLTMSHNTIVVNAMMPSRLPHFRKISLTADDPVAQKCRKLISNKGDLKKFINKETYVFFYDSTDGS